MKNQYIDEKKLQKNGIDNQCSYKKLCEKDEKKFGRTKKVRTFAPANEARDTHLARNCESYLKLQKPKVACLQNIQANKSKGKKI